MLIFLLFLQYHNEKTVKHFENELYRPFCWSGWAVRRLPKSIDIAFKPEEVALPENANVMNDLLADLPTLKQEQVFLEKYLKNIN